MKPIRFFALSLLFLLPACATHGGMRDRGGEAMRARHPIAAPFPIDPLHHVEHFARDLELSKEQMERIRSVRREFTRETIRLRSELEIAYLDLRDMTHKDPKDLNRDQIMRKVDEIGALQTTQNKKNVEAGLELADILNEEQFSKFAELLRKESKMGRGGRGSRFSDENY